MWVMIRGMQPQPRNVWSHQKPEEVRKDPPCSLQREHSPADTLLSTHEPQLFMPKTSEARQRCAGSRGGNHPCSSSLPTCQHSPYSLPCSPCLSEYHPDPCLQARSWSWDGKQLCGASPLGGDRFSPWSMTPASQLFPLQLTTPPPNYRGSS